MQAHSAARSQMTFQQVRAWSVLDEQVLDVMQRLRRELFVPEAWRGATYGDLPIALGDGQHMLRPSVAGRLLQAIALKRGDRVLEIGTGSGYVTACLAMLATHVLSLEIRPALAQRARANLAAAAIGNAEVEEADAFAWDAGSPRFDAIVITGSLPVADPRFEAWLKPGGRLYVVIGAAPVMEATLTRLDASGTASRFGLFETVVDPLDHAPTVAGFTF
ncbi:MAG: protein-L-isoaspartate O-methyltransferase [Proteobacteria bacterium]|jgi:protein-L-isoaspartate(D-aspartate) O-methyltransferase|nr:protein-L-isoaspartate O-methyltransferase [Pseudomonadota bacterium]MBK7115608.1 protein-L-isoaspartate O-methyltransferase [Pseudomonadota bacterium]MBK9250929.1 protein-L-isoaspartate O-methyltransferase [Pseudomonadota bacterium]MCC6633388.1 protein-L-isoaspartate O-methyltransferase [Gammaproteobacteria bacterium]